MNRILGLILFVSLITGFPLASFSQSTPLSETLVSTTITVTVKGKNSSHTIFCRVGVPGTATQRGEQFKFTSYAALISNTRKKSPTSKKLPLFRAILKVGRNVCKEIGTTPPITGTPTSPLPPAPPAASPTATPIVAPTATPPTGNFDNRGNVTEKGKLAFGIPSHLSGNVTAGKQVVTSFCAGCHQERIGYSYSAIDTAIRRAPMLYDESSISRQQLADLVAYLNRFNP